MQNINFDNIKKHWDEYMTLVGVYDSINAQVDVLFQKLSEVKPEDYVTPQTYQAVRASLYRQINALRAEADEMHVLVMKALKASSPRANVLA